ncbi:MAG: EAL domain-containing protein, partial [Thaumarchaeota archaeon]|nr:EAL domain-containing protein [Nitrososphaerota archaeon]
EQTSLVGPVSLYVIDCALEQLMRWKDQDIHLEMSVNLSARNLLDPELPNQIESLLRRHNVVGNKLTVEVTESATMSNPERAGVVLQALRALGVGISIDDFGTGHASIAYLTRLPANELKIDRSFITDICQSPRDEAIVRSTIDLARHLDLKVVAEGIETEEARELLVGLGCETGQGYLLSRPLSAQALTEWLRSPEAKAVSSPEAEAVSARMQLDRSPV